MHEHEHSQQASTNSAQIAEPSVAAVIPVFNSINTVAAAITSVLSQTLSCTEIIVVDDGSTDGVGDLIRTRFPSVRFVRQTNAGAASARNCGVSSAKSQLIAFLDADDLWHPQKIEKQIRVHVSHPEAVASSTDALVIAPTATDLEWPQVATDTFSLADLASVFSHPYLGTPTVMVRRDVFAMVGGFNTELQTAEDIDLWLRLAERGPICRLAAPLAAIRPLPTGLSKRDHDGDRRHLHVLEAFLARNPAFVDRNGKRVRRMTSEILCRIGSGCLLRRETEEAKKVLSRAVTEDLTNTRAWYLLSKAFRG
jgi:glycosyltransferase involved in cell wall biosynthesis